MEPLPTFDTSSQGITVPKPTIPHPDASLGLFSFKRIGNCKVVVYYYSSVVYAALIIDRQNINNNGKGVVQVTARKFRKWAN